MTLNPTIKQSFVNTFGKEPDQYEVLAGGNSGTPVYRLTLDGKQMVARISDVSDSLPAAFKTIAKQVALKEEAVNHLLAKAGLGPKVYHPKPGEPSDGVLITDFSVGRFLTAEDYQSVDLQKLLLKTVRELHQVNVDSAAVLPFGLLKRCEIAFAFVRALNLSSSLQALLESLEEGFQIIQSRLDGLTDKVEIVLCHNDLNPSNVCLFEKEQKIFFIDNVDAGLADPLEDLVSIARFVPAQQLLSEFLQREPGVAEWERFSSYQALLYLKWSLDLIARHVDGFVSLSLSDCACSTAFSQLPLQDKPTEKTDPQALLCSTVAEFKRYL